MYCMVLEHYIGLGHKLEVFVWLDVTCKIGGFAAKQYVVCEFQNPQNFWQLPKSFKSYINCGICTVELLRRSRTRLMKHEDYFFHSGILVPLLIYLLDTPTMPEDNIPLLPEHSGVLQNCSTRVEQVWSAETSERRERSEQNPEHLCFQKKRFDAKEIK